MPVINGLTDLCHPCQALADVLTMRENLVTMQGRKLTLLWCDNPEPKPLGPTHSILQLASLMGMDVTTTLKTWTVQQSLQSVIAFALTVLIYMLF